MADQSESEKDQQRLFWNSRELYGYLAHNLKEHGLHAVIKHALTEWRMHTTDYGKLFFILRIIAINESVATLPGSWVTVPLIVQRLRCLCSSLGLCVALHVHGDPAADLGAGSHAVHRFLHLAMPAKASFNGIGSRGQERIVEKRQRFFQVRREQLV